jgi:hypothetical protein
MDSNLIDKFKQTSGDDRKLLVRVLEAVAAMHETLSHAERLKNEMQWILTGFRVKPLRRRRRELERHRHAVNKEFQKAIETMKTLDSQLVRLTPAGNELLERFNIDVSGLELEQVPVLLAKLRAEKD